MEIYEVGGAVRDGLLGRPVVDRDFVVVGATPDMMRAQGFRPVGQDFPVFLHPITHEEYALARTERKTGHGYHGFSVHADPNVRLEDDLARRDLTINAMARSADGALIDPYGGQKDLQQRVLRHVGPAFAEDPVRILRLARFAARFSDFSIAPDTLSLMQDMVREGEVDHLVAERVWAECAKALGEARPSRFFGVLQEAGALPRLFPELAALIGVPQRAEYHPEGDAWTHTMMVVDAAAAQGTSLPVRWASLLHDLGKALTPQAVLPRHHGHEARGVAPTNALCARLKVPNDCRDLAVLAVKHHGQMHQLDRGDGLRPETIVRLLGEADAWRRPERFNDLLAVCRADYDGRTGERPAYITDQHWRRAHAACLSVDTASIAAACSSPKEIGAAIERARVTAVQRQMAAKTFHQARPEST